MGMGEAEQESRRGEAGKCVWFMPSAAALHVVGWEWQWQCPEARPDELIKQECRQTENLGRACLFLVAFRGSGHGNLPKTQIRHWRRQALLA